MKKLVSLALILMLLLGLASTAAAEWKFERKIDFICPWGVGGGADSTLRTLTTYLKEELGQECEVKNVEGGSGVNGVEYTYKQPADGYTFMLGTQSLIMQELQGNMSMDYRDEFVPVAKLVHSVNIIAGSKKAMDQKGYHSFSEMVKYLEANPYGVTAGMLTATGADGAALAQTLKDLPVLESPYSGGSEMNAALVGGHIDLMITGTDEIAGLIQSGDIVPLVAICENRMKIYPDLECTGELGIDSYIGTWRGIYAKKGTPKEAIDALLAGIAKVVERQEWKDWAHQGAYDERVGFESGENFQKLIDNEYKVFTGYLRDQGTLVKEYPQDK